MKTPANREHTFKKDENEESNILDNSWNFDY